MTTKEDIFNAAPPATGTYDLNGHTLHLREIRLSEQLEWSKFRENHKQTEAVYAKLIQLACVELHDSDPFEICDRIRSVEIIKIGQEVMKLCEMDSKKN